MPRKKPKKHPGGRPKIPPHLQRVKFSVRVPQYVKDGFEKRAKDHGTDSSGRPRSSTGIEVERAFDATEHKPVVGAWSQ